MEYTKGAWTIEDGTQVVSGKRLVANTGGYSTNYSFERGQNEANAKLIAAAPELYEALKALNEKLGNDESIRLQAHGISDEFELYAIHEKVQKALLKAEGK